MNKAVLAAIKSKLAQATLPRSDGFNSSFQGARKNMPVLREDCQGGGFATKFRLTISRRRILFRRLLHAAKGWFSSDSQEFF
jgi:hypothetical protein